MAYGFSVLNNNSQVLISNQARTLHFVGKATYSYLVGSLSQCGGMRCWAYTINCSSVPVPFITMPTTDRYAVIGVRQTATNTWVIEVLRSGTSASMPEVYVFADPTGIVYSGSETHGLRVYADDGSVCFDSRLAPLVVTGGINTAPPDNPLNSGWVLKTGWNGDTQMPTYSYTGGPVGPGNNQCTGDPSAVLTPTSYTANTYIDMANSKPIFFYPSLAQVTRLVSGYYKSGSAKVPNGYGGYIYFSTYRCTSNYWVLYRGGISHIYGQIQCGWIPYVQGGYWQAWKYNAGVSIGVGVYPGSGVAGGSGGKPPYYNESLNLQNTAVIIGNGSRYD